jgi:F-type H+-transporting ATPase subunit epsilon
MAEKGFRLTVFTQEKAVLDQQALSIVAPGSEGYLGILRDHAPLVTQLMPGKLTVKVAETRRSTSSPAGSSR